jgi:hypothetical protein
MTRPRATLESADLDYLHRNGLISSQTFEDLARRAASLPAGKSFEVDREVADEIRSELALHFGVVGLGDDGRANKEGRYIESLIDRLFVL